VRGRAPILASMLPLAHLGHWLWVFYVIPVLIVVVGILVSGHKAKRREERGGDG
jgi:ABC-type polysaccharide/polyol phosphate export permease